MTQDRIERHLDISDLLIRYAVEGIRDREVVSGLGDVWGAVAHYLKSVAKYRGWPNETHRDLNDVATDLAHETDNPEIALYLYRSAGDMHTNFYEDWLLDKDVSDGIEDANELISRLENRARPRHALRPSQQRRRR